MVLGVAGILYGAVLAFGQKDLKRLVAYTSVSHMGFVLLGIFAWNELDSAGNSACRCFATASAPADSLLLLGLLQERLRTRDMELMGGLWSSVPKMGGLAMVFALASLGLPGLGNFVAEFLVLLGVFQKNMAIAAIATFGLVAATIYSLWLVQKVFFGKPRENIRIADVSVRELSVTTGHDCRPPLHRSLSPACAGYSRSGIQAYEDRKKSGNNRHCTESGFNPDNWKERSQNHELR